MPNCVGQGITGVSARCMGSWEVYAEMVKWLSKICSAIGELNGEGRVLCVGKKESEDQGNQGEHGSPNNVARPTAYTVLPQAWCCEHLARCF